MKWNLVKERELSISSKSAPIGEEILAVFEGMAGDVWHAKQEANGEWFGHCFDDEGIQPIRAALICWKPWPKSPFNEDS